MMNYNDNLPDDDMADGHMSDGGDANSQLDSLVARALEVEADADRAQRLATYWQQNSRQQEHVRSRATWTAGLLAASLLVGGSAWLFVRGGEQPQVANVGEEVPTVTKDMPKQRKPPAKDDGPTEAHDESAVPPPQLEVADARSVGREPTELERLMFAAMTGRGSSIKPDTVVQKPSVANGPQVAEAEQGTAKPEAPMLVVNSTEAEVAQYVSGLRETSDESARERMLEHLLVVANEKGLVAYLSLLGDTDLANEALAVALESKAFPLDRLLALLDHEQKQVRWTAANLLARANRCEMTEPLIARINEQPSDSTEVWFTLFTCRCERADEFLAYASQRPQLLGQFNNARLQWQRMGQGAL